MKQLVLTDGDEKLFLTSPSRSDSKFTILGLQTRWADDTFVFLPDSLLMVQEWINGRLEELRKHGYLTDVEG
jgi:hypothetical protein